MPSPSPSPAPDSGAEAAPAKGSPSDFLKHVIGKRVVVRLTSGIDYKGVLTCLDGYMNIALEDCAEWVGGQRRGVYGDAFVRGNNVLYITAA
ncbi:Sm-like ribonucleo protein [Tilletiopsis washingtonensis]|uniref:U6 snRNA-associated Sm-like protein LSm6 n=1 Tax=Tilletiopsis washingtonensis TaxID=58919 RepID=A0A316Z397_9BASI|nr:Sm-like ribonucleo protein [Tilletiopsis washingtonensis]PWN95554.1 Sm-like ribonucleo protein [Tilletiopsis washingtonensis]